MTSDDAPTTTTTTEASATPAAARTPFWRTDGAAAVLLGAAYVVWLLATARSVGFPRDEGVYFRAARDYARWFDVLFTKPSMAFDRSFVDSTWADNHEHPALMKSLFGLSWTFFHEKWHLFKDASTAFRFPAMCTAGMAVGVTYLFAARAYSRRAGFVAAAGLALMPQVFFYSHLACFDVPIMAMWLASVYVYWRADRASSWKALAGWAVAAGVVYGLTLETKHNAWIMPAVVVPHALLATLARWTKDHGSLKLPTAIVATAAMAVIGPLVFYACWPWLWADWHQRVEDYMSFHLNHEYYNIEFLGKNYFSAPSPPSYAPVMIVATVPSITLLLFLIGAVDRGRHARAAARREATYTDVLVALAFVAPLAVFFRPVTPIFGGTKHWLPAYPFLAMLAGRGFDVTADALERALEDRVAVWRAWSERARSAARVALVVVCLAAPLAVTAHAHPFGISAYVPIVGGTAGGADLGLNRQFWGYTTETAAQEYLDRAAPRNASVFIHDTAWDAWTQMQEEGRVRKDLRGAGAPGDAQYALVHHELHMNEVDYQIWAAYGTTAPVYVVRHDGVPFVSIYKHP